MEFSKKNNEMVKSNDTDDLISVIIPTYNRAGVLGRSIQSVLAQTYTNLELLIIDDCSDDGTQELVKEFKDERIRYYRNEENLGASVSRNRGISLAKGKFIAFQDSDDEWLPQKLDRLLDAWKKEGNEAAGMIYHEMKEQGSESFIPSRDIPLEWKSGDMFCHLLLYPLIGATASLIKRSCLDELGGFNEKLESLEDYELYLRMAKNYQILFVGEPLMIIYDTSGSVNKRFKSKIDTELYILDNMYDSLCKYDILQKKVNLIRQQAENYDCEDYFYEQALKRWGDFEKGAAGGEEDPARIKGEHLKECIRNTASETSEAGTGDRAEYYQNAAGQIERAVGGLGRLKENLEKNPAMLSKNRSAICEALTDVIRDLADFTDLAIHPAAERYKMEELLEKITKEKKSDQMIKAVLDGALRETKSLLLQAGKAKCLCAACGKHVRFLPPSPYKRVMRKHYGYKEGKAVFLFEGDSDRCPVCGTPENIRFLLGFLEDIQPEGNEKLKLCCMELPGRQNEAWSERILKYAGRKDYMEYIPMKDVAGDMDVVICADILEQTKDTGKVLEKIHGMLKADGICVVMISALLKEGKEQKEAKDSMALTETQKDKESYREFGLEGVNRIYSKQELLCEFEEKGFEVSTADMDWFGSEYYEKCGFGEYAQLFMLAKK